MLPIDQTMMAEMPTLRRAARFVGDLPSADHPDANAGAASFVFIKKGRGEATIDSKTYSVREGEVVICHPSVPFLLRSSMDNPLQGIHVELTFRLFEKASGELLEAGQSPVVPLRQHVLNMENFFETIVQESENPSIGSREMTNLFLQAVTITLVRMLESMKAPDHTSITQRVKEYIEAHFDSDLSLSDLAELVFVNPYHLIHTFKSDMGQTPIQYLIHCRIEEAKRLLKSTDLSIHDISLRIGYPNPNYFNQMFKKIVGVTPGKYRTDVRQ